MLPVCYLELQSRPLEHICNCLNFDFNKILLISAEILMQPKTSERDSTAFRLLGYCLPGSFRVLRFLSDLSSVLQLYTMDKLQKILLAAAPIIAQPPPLPPVLQVATQAGIIQYLQDAGDSELGMVRFGSVQFFEGFWRTQNRTIGSVHRLWRTLDRTVGSVQNGQVLVLKWSELRTGLIDVCRIPGQA